jgi:hypothetical protein
MWLSRFQPPLPEPGRHAFHAPRLSRMDCSIHADLLAHPSKPAILKPTPGALRRVAGSPNLRLLPLLCDHAALAEEVIPKLPMIVAPSVGAPFVISCSLQAGSGAGCMSASYLRSYHRMWAITPSRRIGTFRHDWGSANTGFAIDGLAAWSSGSWCWSFNRLLTSCYCPPKPFG